MQNQPLLPFVNETEMKNENVLEHLEKNGRLIAKSDNRLTKFAQMLSHPEFSEFFDDNFNDWTDCQQSIMLLKMGSYLRDTISTSTGEPITGNQLLGAMKSALDNKDTRRFMIQSLYDFMKSDPQGESYKSSETFMTLPRGSDLLQTNQNNKIEN